MIPVGDLSSIDETRRYSCRLKNCFALLTASTPLLRLTCCHIANRSAHQQRGLYRASLSLTCRRIRSWEE